MPRTPDPIVSQKLSQEEIELISHKRLQEIPLERLQMIKEYYENVLELFCGTQVWDILDSYNSCKNRINKLKNTNKYISERPL